jgi:hypothetical protein
VRCGASTRNPIASHVLGKAIFADAESKHRRICTLEIKLSVVDLAEMHEKLRLKAGAPQDEFLRRGEKSIAVQGFDGSD